MDNLSQQDKQIIEKQLLAQIDELDSQEKIDRFLEEYKPVLASMGLTVSDAFRMCDEGSATRPIKIV